MKKLITGLVLGLGLLQGAQADTQTQTFDFIVPADSLGYTGSQSFAAFDGSLGTLTRVEFSYYFETHFSYSVTNDGASPINSVNLLAQDGNLFFSVSSSMEPDPFWMRGATITGSNSFFLAPGQTMSDSELVMTASAKGSDSINVFGHFGPMGPMDIFPTDFTVAYQIDTPYLSIGASGRGVRLSTFAGSQDVQASMSLSYIYEAAPVPEPESYAMFLAGLGLIGAMARRRRML